MKIVVAPNAFKGSLSATVAAASIAGGVHRVLADAEIVQVPVADGGDGLVNVALEVFQGTKRDVTVTGPDFVPVTASYCHAPGRNVAAIEMAQASGLALLPSSRRDPTRTTTLGTGELIRAALDTGASHILVGIGGSATNDGGIGAAAALGIKFLEHKGNPVPLTGGGLSSIAHIDCNARDSRLENIRLDVACDVTNPLTGPTGAARMYAPQKGASPEQTDQLEEGMENLAACIQRDLGIEVRSLAGGGAAGGLGAGLYAFLGAELRPGVDLILDLVELDRKLANADLVITGEGQIDIQTTFGKAPAGVAARAKAQGVPCIALAGSIGENLGDLHQQGLDAVFSICQGPLSLEQAMQRSETLLALAAEQAVRCFFAVHNKRKR